MNYSNKRSLKDVLTDILNYLKETIYYLDHYQMIWVNTLHINFFVGKKCEMLRFEILEGSIYCQQCGAGNWIHVRYKNWRRLTVIFRTDVDDLRNLKDYMCRR